LIALTSVVYQLNLANQPLFRIVLRLKGIVLAACIYARTGTELACPEPVEGALVSPKKGIFETKQKTIQWHKGEIGQGRHRGLPLQGRLVYDKSALAPGTPMLS